MRQTVSPQTNSRQRQRQYQAPTNAQTALLLEQLTETLRGVQDEQREQAEINKNTAVALTEVVQRLKGVERWQDEADQRRERQEERRDSRDDHAPDQQRATWALAVSGLMAAFYLLTYLSAHWKP